MATKEADTPERGKPSPIWLDCTLRDGGYQNNWEFPDAITKHYLRAMQDARADRVELGFRTLSRYGYRGSTAFTSDSFLESLTIPRGLRIGVMVNVAELTGSPKEMAAKLATLFPDTSPQHVSLVRLAAHISELDLAVTAAGWLSQQGYEVGLNIMQISEASDDFLRGLGETIPAEDVDVLYIADSLGTLNPKETSQVMANIRLGWGGALGMHAHDNRGLALANSLAALESGATWVDSTVLGMGRGAGNTRSEILLGHLSQYSRDTGSSAELENVIDNYFEPLRRKSSWGPSIHYVNAAAKGIHPTFIQQLTANSSYSSVERTTAIEILGASGAQKFSDEKLQETLTWVQDFDSPRSEWDQTQMFQDSQVLLLGAGDSVASHATALTHFIRQQKPVTVATNLGGVIDEDLIDAHISCHPLRLVGDVARYSQLKSLLIAPGRLLPGSLRADLTQSNLLRDVGIRRTDLAVGAKPGIVSLPAPQVLAYSLLVCLSGGAKAIYLAGFDGYAEGDPRRQLEQNLINAILDLGFPGEVLALTPTKFDLPQSSVHGMLS